jgi:hypothetical protein
MADRTSDPRSEPAADDECSSCHRLVPGQELTRMGTRLVCWGCLAAWYDDDGEPLGENDGDGSPDR